MKVGFIQMRMTIVQCRQSLSWPLHPAYLQDLSMGNINLLKSRADELHADYIPGAR